MLPIKIRLIIVTFCCITNCFAVNKKINDYFWKSKKRNLTQLPSNEISYNVYYLDGNNPIFDTINKKKLQTFAPYTKNEKRIAEESYRILKKYHYSYIPELIQVPSGNFMRVLSEFVTIHKYHYDNQGNYLDEIITKQSFHHFR